jgi:hypothetical protein
MQATRYTGIAAALAVAAYLLGPARAAAQSGAGTTGATVLQLLSGSRAAALSGAYTAARYDADVLFYNPAGIASLNAGAALSYQRHVEDIGVASGAGVLRVGGIVLGAGVTFLDVGEIEEIRPDPAFGGQTGLPTGNTVTASETAGRVAAALDLMDERFQVGASLGLVSVNLAGVSRSTPMFDVGAQFVMPSVTLGASLRNAGGTLSGEDLADAELPTEARLGAAVQMTRPSGFGATLVADLIAGLRDSSTGLVAGVEAGLLPASNGRIGAVGRFGYNGAAGDDGLGTLQLGAGVTLGNFAVDYAYQSYDNFGSLHRFGVRWARLP